MHVSKPPKESTPGHRLVEAFKEVGGLFPDVSFKLVHKKVNLADELVAWEHERFSLRRLPAGTLSHFSHPKDAARMSMFETKYVEIFYFFISFARSFFKEIFRTVKRPI